MQMSLRDSVFETLPGKRHHYVPVLQSRSGELDALHHVVASDWTYLTPLICARGDKQPRDLTDARLREWTKKISLAVGGAVFYVDTLRQDPSSPVAVRGVAHPMLRRLHERLRLRGANFIPVLQDAWTGTATAVEAVQQAHDLDGRGVALRLDLGSGVSIGGLSIEQRAQTSLRALDMEARQVDLLVDLGYLEPDSEPDVQGISESVQKLVKAEAWRNVVCLATSMPSSMTKALVAPGSLGSLPRHERDMYLAVSQALDGFPVVYGDYAVQHPTPPATGGPGMLPNIRYTTSDRTLVVRGVKQVVQGGNEEYPDLCRRLEGHDAYRGKSFTWGDGVIHECGAGNLTPGGSSMWRGAATSHHFKEVLAELA